MIEATHRFRGEIRRLAVLFVLLAASLGALPPIDRPAAAAPAAIAALSSSSGESEALADPGLAPPDRQRSDGGPDDPAPVVLLGAALPAAGQHAAHHASSESLRSGDPLRAYRARAPPRA